MAELHLYDVIRRPVVSEKANIISEERNQYVFEVVQAATKADVKAAVEGLFSVEVASVNLVNLKGKSRSFRNRAGTRGNKRKAYVRLADGHTIDVTAKP